MAEEGGDAMEAIAPIDPMIFDPSMKKKKKKKKTEDGTAGDQADEAPQNGEGDDKEDNEMQEENAPAGEEGADVTKVEEDFQAMDFGKKKKKKKKVEFGEGDESAIQDSETFGAAMADEAKVVSSGLPWDGSDRDYTYEELVDRAFQFLHGKNPALAGEKRKKLRLKPPQVAREGSRKTVFLNFGEICKAIHRQTDHLLGYLTAELGTTGNLQDGGRLVIKGRFQPEGIENVLRKYVMEYVICASCRSPETVLMRDANTRLYFLQCESCGATRSVAQIRQGFMAQVERRKKG